MSIRNITPAVLLCLALACPAHAQISGTPTISCQPGICVAAQDGGTLPTGVTQPAGGTGLTGLLGGIYAKLLGSLAVTGTFWQAVQPVSGTVAVSNLPPAGNGSDSTVTAPAALTTLVTFTVTNPGAYRVQNQSAATIQYQLCATGGTGCTTFLLAPGAGANAQGADTSPEVQWFTGVINVLGVPGAQFAARHN